MSVISPFHSTLLMDITTTNDYTVNQLQSTNFHCLLSSSNKNIEIAKAEGMLPLKRYIHISPICAVFLELRIRLLQS